jgi:hypothetical protein
MVRIPRPGEKRESSGFVIANDDAEELIRAIGPTLERAEGTGWYDSVASDVDLATFLLCRLRRARAGVGGAMEHGDRAVRDVLAEASPEALVWLASRTISYMDESGYPESVERLFPESVIAHAEAQEESAG